jgi:hypothetical protein
MCISKRVRASDTSIASLASPRDRLQAAFALSASSSNLRLLGQGILASTGLVETFTNSELSTVTVSIIMVIRVSALTGRSGSGSSPPGQVCARQLFHDVLCHSLRSAHCGTEIWLCAIGINYEHLSILWSERNARIFGVGAILLLIAALLCALVGISYEPALAQAGKSHFSTRIPFSSGGFGWWSGFPYSTGWL